jgi:hypothetical protein
MANGKWQMVQWTMVEALAVFTTFRDNFQHFGLISVRRDS